MVKCGIEAGQLNDARELLIERFDKGYLCGQVLGIERHQSLQFRNNLRSDDLRAPISWPAVYDPVANGHNPPATKHVLHFVKDRC